MPQYVFYVMPVHKRNMSTIIYLNRYLVFTYMVTVKFLSKINLLS